MENNYFVRRETLKRLMRWMPKQRAFLFMKTLNRSDACSMCGGTGQMPWRPGWEYTCSQCRGNGVEGARLTPRELDRLDEVGPDRFIREYAKQTHDQNLSDWKKREQKRRKTTEYKEAYEKGKEEAKTHQSRLDEERQRAYNGIPRLGRPGQWVEVEGVVMTIRTGLKPSEYGFGKTSWYLTTVKMASGHEVIYWNKFDDVNEGDWIKFQAVVKIEGKHAKSGVRRTEVLNAQLISSQAYVSA